jgi:3-keto-5-aminohexanoate cleavage enzyme
MQCFLKTPDKTADSIYAAYQAGAAMVHVHARDSANLTLGAKCTDDWPAMNRKIRERCRDIVINNTVGGDLVMTIDERLSR